MQKSRYSNWSTVELTEMPRLRSSSIQSEVVVRWFFRAVTDPASWTAPPYSSSFSVRVVLPASGWEMIANVRRRATSFIKSTASPSRYQRAPANKSPRQRGRGGEFTSSAARGQPQSP